MPNAWGRTPRYDFWRDLQFLALWIFIIGVVGYLLFPGLFDNVYEKITGKTDDEGDLYDYTIPATTDYSSLYPTYSDSTYNLYNPYSSSNESELSTGYWALFVADGELKQLNLTTEGYAFVSGLVKDDQKSTGEETLILIENGQVHKYSINPELYQILVNLASIVERTDR